MNIKLNPSASPYKEFTVLLALCLLQKNGHIYHYFKLLQACTGWWYVVSDIHFQSKYEHQISVTFQKVYFQTIYPISLPIKWIKYCQRANSLLLIKILIFFGHDY